MTIDIYSYKDILFKIVQNPDNINKQSKNELINIPQKIKEFYQDATERSSSGLEGLKAKKDALLSSLYYSYIALHCLNPSANERQQIQTQVLEMIQNYGGNVEDFEKQYDDLVIKFNTSFLDAKKQHLEITDKDKINHKFCVILADILQIPLNDKEKNGEGPLPARIPTTEDAIAYNKIALTLNRQAELSRVRKYHKLLHSTFLSDSELIKQDSDMGVVMSQYEKVMEHDFSHLSADEIEHLQLLIKHYARNIGLNLTMTKEIEQYPLIGVDVISFGSLESKWPDYELKFLFMLNVIKYDLLTALFKLFHRPTDFHEQLYSAYEKIDLIGTRLALYANANPSVEDWEKSLATELCINSFNKFVEVTNSQKVGQEPWIFDFIDQKKISPFYDNLLLEIENDKKKISIFLKLQKELSTCKNEKKSKGLSQKLLPLNDFLLEKFQTTDPQALKQILGQLSFNKSILQFIIDGIDPISHKKSKSMIGSGKWWSFGHRVIKFD